MIAGGGGSKRRVRVGCGRKGGAYMDRAKATQTSRQSPNSGALPFQGPPWHLACPCLGHGLSPFPQNPPLCLTPLPLLGYPVSSVRAQAWHPGAPAWQSWSCQLFSPPQPCSTLGTSSSPSTLSCLPSTWTEWVLLARPLSVYPGLQALLWFALVPS